MTTKTKVIIAVISLATAFAFGRYSNQAPTVKTEINKNTDTNTKTATDKKKVTVITKDRDGKETTVITEEDKTIVDKNKNISETISQTIIPPKRNIINISALAGMDTLNSFRPVYGISANKEFIGPITIGAYGLTNGVLGISIGLNF